MTRREKIGWLIIGLVYVVGLLSLIPSHHEICEIVEKTCTSYQLVTFVGIKTVQILDKMGGVLTALATIAIAWFTLTLRKSTDKLWDAGERQLTLLSENSAAQSRDMQASIGAAEIAAKAAKASADSAVAIERARLYVVIDHNFLKCISAANNWDGPMDQEERPLTMDTWPMASITFRNYGKTPAIIEEVATNIEYSELPPIPVHDVKVVNKNIVEAAGDSEKFGTVIDGQITIAKAKNVKSGRANIWVYGYVIYNDVFGERRTHRFFQRLVRISQASYALQSYDYQHHNMST